MKTCLLVLDDVHARFFNKFRGNKLELVHEITHEESRMRNSEINSDGYGRAFNSVGSAKHAVTPQTSAHDHQIEKFVREVSHWLKNHHFANQFDALQIVASDRLIGMLRKILPENIQRMVTEEIHKTFESKFSTAEIKGQLEAQHI